MEKTLKTNEGWKKPRFGKENPENIKVQKTLKVIGFTKP